MNNSINLRYSYFIFVTVFINIFLVKLMPISPVYIGFALSVVFLYLLFSINKDISFLIYSSSDNSIIVLIFLLCINAFLTTIINLANIKTLCTLVFTYLCFFVASVITIIPKKIVYKTLMTLKYLSIIMYTIEAVYRFINSVAKHSYFYIYDYKFNTIMFPDTNATAVCIEFFLCFLIYLKMRNIIKVSFFDILVTSALLILTFSRAAIIGVISVLFCLYFMKCSSYIVKFVIFFLVFSLFIFIFYYFFTDGSFITKMDLFVQTINYIKNIDFFHLFVGNGLDSSVKFLSRYGHTYVTLYIIELGFNGLFLLYTLFILLFVKQKYTMVLIIPFVVTGLSYMPFVIPFFYLFLGFIYYIESYRKDLFNLVNRKGKKNE